MNKKDAIILHLSNNSINIKTTNQKEKYWRLEFDNGSIVNCYDTGKYSVQGKNAEITKAHLANFETNTHTNVTSNKIFIVYGHDNVARNELELLIYKLKLEPIILDKLSPNGKTIIEQLESNMKGVNCGIVLATPDDKGCSAKESDNSKLKYRVRQNVVLELGMLIASIGRDKTIILLNEKEGMEMEKPSDIQGLIYHSFKNNIDEIKVPLAQQLKELGYNISIENL